MSAEAPEPRDGEIVDSRVGLMTIRVGGRSYAARHVPQCKVCRSQYRSEIEYAVLAGLPYNKVVEEAVTPFDDHSELGTPTVTGVMTHVRRKHMPVSLSMQRQIIEERAAELGHNVEDSEKLILDNIGIVRSITQRGWDRLNKGEIEPSMGDLIKALQIQAVVGTQDQDGTSEDVWRATLMEYMAIVSRCAPPGVLAQIKHEMTNSSVLREIAAQRRQTISGELES